MESWRCVEQLSLYHPSFTPRKKKTRYTLSRDYLTTLPVSDTVRLARLALEKRDLGQIVSNRDSTEEISWHLHEVTV
jgi:hypothetical protein